MGKSRESSPRMQAVPVGLLPAVQAERRAGLEGRSQPVQAELRAGLEGRSQPESAGWGQREGIPILPTWAWGNAACCNAWLQLQGLCFPVKPSTPPLWPGLQGRNVREAPGGQLQVCCIRDMPPAKLINPKYSGLRGGTKLMWPDSISHRLAKAGLCTMPSHSTGLNHTGC